MLCFFYWVYLKLLRNSKHKNLVAGAIVVTAIAYLVSLFFQNPLHSSLYYADFFWFILLDFVCNSVFQRKSKGREDLYPKT